MKVLATYNIKGGVGKTSAAVNLAYLAAGSGRRTLLWDLDPQGAATYLFKLRPAVRGGGRSLIRGKRELDDVVQATEYERLDVVPADFRYRTMDLALEAEKKPTRRLRRLLERTARDYDLAVLDCPPSVSLVSENVLQAAQLLVVPLIPTTLSVRSYEQLRTFAAQAPPPQPRTLAFFSLVDRRRRLHRETVERMIQEEGVAGAIVPQSTLVEQMSVRQAPVNVFAPKSAVAEAYAQLWAEARARL
ncbi:MAG: ParA family protein [Candidatus Dormibacteraceae bacterium]